MHTNFPFVQLLIPTASVLKVSKEKTAKIIPNAVGIATMHERHVFGSLLSRDATYKLMIQVWKNATEPEAIEDTLVLPKVIGGWRSSRVWSSKRAVLI